MRLPPAARAPRLGLLVLLLALPGDAAPRPASADAAAVLRRAREALGGDSALARVRDVVTRADCKGPRRAYVTEIRSARDGRAFMRQTFGKGDAWTAGIRGDVKWQRDGETGPYRLADASTAEAVRGHEWHALVLFFEERYAAPQLAGRSERDGRSLVKLSLVDAFGRPAAAAFDEETGLPVELTFTNASEKGPAQVFVELADWRTVQGVKLFHRAVARHGSEEYRFVYDSVKLNAADPASFALADDVVALLSRPARDPAAELLAVHAADRRAHMETSPQLILEHADDTFLAVFAGKLTRQSREDVKKMFERVFDGASYLEWNDLEPPVVRVSKDGTLGWMAVRVKVRRMKKDASGIPREEKFVYAGIMTYERKDDRWVRTANVSTFEP